MFKGFQNGDKAKKEKKKHEHMAELLTGEDAQKKLRKHSL